MPFIQVPATVLVEFRMTADLQQVENTIYFTFQDPYGATEMTALGEDMVTWWVANLAPLIWSGVQLREVVVTDLDSATGPQVSVIPATTTFGEQNLAPLPNSVSLTVSFRTALRGRSFRGRNYVVGLVEAQTSGANVVDGATLAAYINAYEGLIAIAGANGADWVVVSRFSGVDGNGDPIPRATGIATPITTVLVVDNVVDNQRRRLPGRGN